MTQDDMLAIASYVGSLPPATEESFSNAPEDQTSASLVAEGNKRKAVK
jgi:hypothetical protein